VEQALNQLVQDGYTHVAIQSLHVIPGSEYQEILRAAWAFRRSGALQRVCVGRPLLSSQQDVDNVAEALLELLPPLEDGHGVVVVAHGSSHPGRARLSELLQKLERRRTRVLTETLEANGWSALMDRIARLNLSKVWLYPLLLAPGRHLHRDILGPDPDSLVSILKKNDIDSEVLNQSVAACDDVAAIWLGHLETALGTMADPREAEQEEN
jgi:sirohydrochlorin cobaltochelatase